MNFKRQGFWKGKKMVVTDIGKRIRLAREIAGFTQENLASLCQLCAANLEQYYRAYAGQEEEKTDL